MAEKVTPLRKAVIVRAGSIGKSPPHPEIISLKSKIGDRWPALLEALAPALTEALESNGEHGPCPIHGGVDGFRFFDDYETTGGGVCNTCGAFADGIALLQEVNGWSFLEVVKAIQRWLRENREDDEIVAQVGEDREEASLQAGPILNEKALAYINAVVEERAIPGHAAIQNYYKQRHLSIVPPPTIGFVDKEYYCDKETGKKEALPAILAPLQDVNGEPVSILRTYLDPEGNGKAGVTAPKKLSQAVHPGATRGAAIRLRDVEDGVLGVAEGIETAESVFQATGVATWATVSAGGLASFEVPEGESISRVVIFADNDASGVGQKAADTLARRLVSKGLEVSVLLPPDRDTDWNDVLAVIGEEPIRQALADAKPFDPSLPPRKIEAKVAAPAASTKDEVVAADPVSVLNQRHFLVPIGGTMCVATETREPISGRLQLAFGKQNDLNLRYCNWRTGEGTAASVWLGSRRRREYQGLVFAPGKQTPGFYNLFRGFPVEPVKGECHLFWQHLFFVICRGDRGHYRYLRKWLAHLFQRPDELPGVAIVIQGKQGTGKSIFVDFVGSLLGQHFLTLVRMEQLTGRFCGHLMDLLLVCANEALWGGDKVGEGALKAMITDPTMAVEFKGKDITHVANYKRLLVMTNESWPVPMGMDDRRFFVLEASDARKEDKGYFGALARQMDNGGRAALMYDLLHEDLSGFDVRTKPKSTYGFDIKIRSAEPIARWWYETLHEGCTVSNSELDQGNRWNSTPSKKQLHESFVNFCSTHRLRTLDRATFGKELRKLLPGCIVGETRIHILEHTDETVAALSGPPRRDHCYRLPTLPQCRQAFQEYSKSGPDIWPEGVGSGTQKQ